MKIIESIENLVSEKCCHCFTCKTGYTSFTDPLCEECLRDMKNRLRSRLGGQENWGERTLYYAGEYDGAWANMIRLLKGQPKDALPDLLRKLLHQILDHWLLELQALEVNLVLHVPSHPLRSYFESDLSRLLKNYLSEGLFIADQKQVLAYPDLGLWPWKAQRKNLSKAQRRVSLDSRPFRLKKGVSLVNKRVLLVDDVCTTGLSLRSCCEVLEKAGAKVEACFVLARVPSPQSLG